MVLPKLYFMLQLRMRIARIGDSTILFPDTRNLFLLRLNGCFWLVTQPKPAPLRQRF